ncbi:hypothetical protein [Fodinibius sediminis]|uniref:Lipocalin-like domain-containing protein n=1 Tax=Fodinibius sediminis TaxID=1214077 RepID=A0A521E666_9BACT|nr:hypothetical protein [Fodinibius sediminis]SMO79352.1 hypothetical protein SAMN06265218_113125 [Fodinibius sediminis]
MKYVISWLLLFMIVHSGAVVYAQDNPLTGLWMIENVQVGGQEMTPVAKWTRINPDGTYESGNGWLKNSEGTWTYNEQARTFLAKETNGLTDPYGAFTVGLEEEQMKWVRTEEGQEVTVRMTRIHEIPRSPADKVQGLWEVDRDTHDGKKASSTSDPGKRHTLFIRWDRTYMEHTPEGQRQTGYWHMNAHRPEITFLSHGGEQKPPSWRIKVINDHEMVMTGLADSTKGQVVRYSRLKSFPE